MATSGAKVAGDTCKWDVRHAQFKKWHTASTRKGGIRGGSVWILPIQQLFPIRFTAHGIFDPRMTEKEWNNKRREQK
jgi:hypothetical protein